MSYFREQLEAWLKTIEIIDKDVLDVGGSAKSLSGRLRTFDPKKYKILDNGAETKELIHYYYDINHLIDLPHQFDVVFCLEVFEYIYNPVQALENLVSFLRDGGVAYISFPAIYPVHEPKEIDYLRYTKKGIEKLLANSGFTSWNITPRVATLGRDSLAYFYQQEGMHPVKGDEVIYDIGYMVEAYVGKRGDMK